MAKTTRNNETSPEATQRAPRRKTADASVTGAETTITRRRMKTETGTAQAAATADSRPAKSEWLVGAAPVVEPTHDEIAARAHDIFLRRHATHGHAAHDWFQARAELLEERGLKA